MSFDPIRQQLSQLTVDSATAVRCNSKGWCLLHSPKKFTPLQPIVQNISRKKARQLSSDKINARQNMPSSGRADCSVSGCSETRWMSCLLRGGGADVELSKQPVSTQPVHSD